jgi:hypothetical protein
MAMATEIRPTERYERFCSGHPQVPPIIRSELVDGHTRDRFVELPFQRGSGRTSVLFKRFQSSISFQIAASISDACEGSKIQAFQ